MRVRRCFSCQLIIIDSKLVRDGGITVGAFLCIYHYLHVYIFTLHKSYVQAVVGKLLLKSSGVTLLPLLATYNLLTVFIVTVSLQLLVTDILNATR
jgi:hypothetical protein